MDWKKLQNGSDIRGVALEGVPGESVNITPEVTSIIAKAFIVWLQKRTNDKQVALVQLDQFGNPGHTDVDL